MTDRLFMNPEVSSMTYCRLEQKEMRNKVMKILIVGVVLFLVSTGLQAASSCWISDADHGELRFNGSVEGNGFSGVFESFSVEVCLADADDPTSARITVEVDVASANTRNRDRDETLLGPEFFAVETFPVASWQSDSIVATEDGYLAEGELNLRDVSADQPVHLRFELSGESPTLEGHAEILRLRYNVGTGEFEDTDFVRNRVDLEFSLELEDVE